MAADLSTHLLKPFSSFLSRYGFHCHDCSCPTQGEDVSNVLGCKDENFVYFSDIMAVPGFSIYTITAKPRTLAVTMGASDRVFEWFSRYLSKLPFVHRLALPDSERAGGHAWFSCLNSSSKLPSCFWQARQSRSALVTLFYLICEIKLENYVCIYILPKKHFDPYRLLTRTGTCICLLC